MEGVPFVSNIFFFGESVDLDLNFGTFYFPDFPIPDGHTYDSYLDKLVWEGLKFRYGWELPAEVVERANYELDIVKKMGFYGFSYTNLSKPTVECYMTYEYYLSTPSAADRQLI